MHHCSLSCRRRRRRFTDRIHRRRSAQQQTADDETTGFFWEDLSQLQYWNPLSSPLRRGSSDNPKGDGFQEQEEDDMLVNDDGLDEEEYDAIIRHSSDTDASTAMVGEDTFLSLAAWNEAYQNHGEENDDNMDIMDSSITSSLTMEDAEPSQEHLRRSKAALRKFEDPAWKAYWYERRWGGAKRRSVAEERLHQRLSSILQPSSQAELLAPLANMTQAEMAEAIVEYVSANQQRSLSQRAWVAHQAEARRDRIHVPSTASDSIDAFARCVSLPKER